MKKCLFCAEEIQDDAIKCKHCGEMLQKASISQKGIKYTIIEKLDDGRGFECRGAVIAKNAEVARCLAIEQCKGANVKDENVTVKEISKIDSPIKTKLSGLSHYYQDEFERIYDSNETYKGKWNWTAFFFGPLWALTKGVWVASIIDVTATILTGGLAAVIYWFAFALRGNYMYYVAFVKNKQLPI